MKYRRNKNYNQKSSSEKSKEKKDDLTDSYEKLKDNN